jgi:hypothetical protein
LNQRAGYRPGKKRIIHMAGRSQGRCGEGVGVLNNAWQFLDRPILLHGYLEDTSNRVILCLLLYNIMLIDRVMQEGSASYIQRERYI